MDVRLSSEQRALRDAAAQLVDRLGPKSVADLGDQARRDKLESALAASGWRELRSGSDDGNPWATAVEAALVTEELGRGLADAAFLGPTLAADLRRLGTAPPAQERETVAMAADLAALARPNPGTPGPPAVLADAAGSVAALHLVATQDGNRLASTRLRDAADTGIDLTRAWVSIDLAGTEAAAQSEPWHLSDDDLDRWNAFGLALACADLVGVMRGTIDLACAYAGTRRQYGAPIGSFQAVQHLLADAFVALEGSRTLALYAAWAVDSVPPHEALVAGATAKAYCARAAQSVCETSIQVHGGIGNTWECLAHVFLRRAIASSDLLGNIGPSLALVLNEQIGSPMDFGDSPEEAAFRAELREWLRHNTPSLPASSTSDEYWAGQAEWHQALYDAGFFGLSWPKDIGGHEMPSVFEVIVDDELAAAGAPPRPSLGYLVQGILRHGNEDVRQRFLPGIVNGRDRWCQGFSEPEAGSDLASLRTRAVRDGDEYVVSGHKVWTSYSDAADWCIVLARTDPDVAKHKGLSAFRVSMRQPGVQQRPLRMINGITREFGEVHFDGARVPATDMVGEPGDGWQLAMTVVSHEREPGELGYVARYRKLVKELGRRVQSAPEDYATESLRDLAWALVESEMLRLHVCRRLSDRLDGMSHGPEGSVDKLLMTQVEQAVGRAALSVGGAAHDGHDDIWLKVYLYSRAQSVMGGTSQIQRNLVASRILGLPAA